MKAYTISQQNRQDCVDTFRNVTVIYICPCRNTMRPICGNIDDTTAPLPHPNGNEYLPALVSTLRITQNWRLPNLVSMEGAAGRPIETLSGRIALERPHETEHSHEEKQHCGSISRDACS